MGKWNKKHITIPNKVFKFLKSKKGKERQKKKQKAQSKMVGNS